MRTSNLQTILVISLYSMFDIFNIGLLKMTAFASPSSSSLSSILSTSNPIPNDLTSKPLLENLEDIEALSYFLLSSHNQNKCKSNSDLRLGNSKEDTKWCNKNLTESSLFKFFENLRDNLIGGTSRFLKPMDCEHEVDGYMKLMYNLTSSSNSNFNSKESNNQNTLHNNISAGTGSGSTSSTATINQLRRKLLAICSAATKCHSSEDMLNLIRKSGLSNDVDYEEDTGLRLSHSIVKLCPVILFQLHDEKCSSNLASDESLSARPSIGSVWGFSFLFVTIISFCSLVGVMIMPFIDKDSFTNAMNLLEGLAVGSLVGSSLFHLIPQAFDLVIKYPSHDFLWKALIIFGGIYLFFWSERIMKIVSEFKRKKKLAQVNVPSSSDGAHSNLASGFNAMKHVYFRDMGDDDGNKTLTANGSLPEVHPLQETARSNNNSDDRSSSSATAANHHHHHFNHQQEQQPNDHSHHSLLARKTSVSTSSLNKHFHSHFVDPATNGTGEQNIATVAWMIILGDGLHNFIDGLSVGAAFSNSILTGISTSVAVICEEFPHELGDFAVLISSGMTLRQAIGYNFLSACTCYLGMILGIIIGDFTAGSTYIFALAGGMFLYIALVDMMAELSAALDDAMARSTSSMIKALILQNVGILLGVATLFCLAKYSSQINFEGLAPFDQSELPIAMTENAGDV